MPKPRPLVTRLRAARILLRQEHRIICDSERSIDGTFPDEVEKLLARFDEAYAALTEAIKREVGRA